MLWITLIRKFWIEINGVQISYQSDSTVEYGLEQNEASLDGSVNFQEQASTVGSNYPTDAQGLYRDPNPEIIRRPALGDSQVYTQRVSVKFLQPPPLPPPGVSLSKIAWKRRECKCLFSH